MPIKPVDVRRRDFGLSFRGYNRDQVDDFLDSVADEYELSYTENARLREEVSGLRERLEQFERLEDSIRAALVRAEQAAEEMKRSATSEADNLVNNANREAELTIKDAQTRSQQILADASSKLEQAQESYGALKEAKTTFASDFRYLLKAYIEVLDNVGVMSAREIENSLRGRFHPDAVEAIHKVAAGQEETDPAEEQIENQDSPRAITSSTEERKTDGGMPEQEPEATGPEFEPSAAGEESEPGKIETETEAADEVEREEPPHAEDGPADDSREDADRERGSEEDENRISRASRFLRRLG